MHKVLERQIKKFLSDDTKPKGWLEFIRSVDESYINSDEDRKLLDGAINITSNEFHEINTRLRNQQKELELKINDLQNTRKAVLNLLEDIDQEKKKVEQKVKDRTSELLSEKQKMETVLSSVGEGVIAVDKNAIVFLYNKKAEEILGYNPSEVINHNVVEVIHADEQEGTPLNPDNRPILLALKGQISEINLLVINKYGIRIPVAVIAAPIMNDGKVTGAISIFRDITKEKEVEQSKTDFLAIASHEMRTPLAIIKGKAERLLKKSSAFQDQKITDEINSIKRNSDRLLGIVNDFLDVIMLEEQRIEFRYEAVDINKIIAEVVSELTPRANEKNISLIFNNKGQDILNATVDFARMKQVCLNLVNNALNYTEKGSVTIEASYEKEELKIRIIDTGIGIPKEKQSLLFKRFSTVSGTFMHSKEYGSGLGLYISHLLISAMGGKIVLEKSEPSQGTTFAIVIPKKTE